MAEEVMTEDVVAEGVVAGALLVVEEVFLVHSSQETVTHEVDSIVLVMGEVVEDRRVVVGGQGTVV